MTEALRKQDCEVTAIEVDAELAAHARPFCAKLVIADIEQREWERELEGEQFDVVLLGDILEHLKGPRDLLLRIKRYLGAGGYLVVSIPNIAHGSVRLALLTGSFRYQPAGLLDETHLRFFTLESIRRLFDEADYEITKLKRIRRGLFETEVEVDPANVAYTLLRGLCRDPEANVYQYVFCAVPREQHQSSQEEDNGCTEYRWDEKQAGTELAMTYLRASQKYFWNNPVRARRLLCRAFWLKPGAWTSIAIVVSLLPYRVAWAIDRAVGLLTRLTDNSITVAGTM